LLLANVFITGHDDDKYIDKEEVYRHGDNDNNDDREAEDVTKRFRLKKTAVGMKRNKKPIGNKMFIKDLGVDRDYSEVLMSSQIAVFRK
jgi:hypothetical protein